MRQEIMAASRSYLNLFAVTAGLALLIHIGMTALCLYPSYWWTSRLLPPPDGLWLMFVLVPVPAVICSVVVAHRWRHARSILTGALLAQLLLKLIDEWSDFALGRTLVHDSAQWVWLACIYGCISALGALAGLALSEHRLRSSIGNALA